MRTRICPRCEKSEPYVIVEKMDRNTSKTWLVEICQRCGFGYNLEEKSAHIDKPTYHDYPPVNPRTTGGGWII